MSKPCTDTEMDWITAALIGFLLLDALVAWMLAA
jgi:hypothetical protein